MSEKMNLLVNINGYSDLNASNSPSLNNVNWCRDMQGIDITDPVSTSIKLPAGESAILFSGNVTSSDDATTTWDIALKSGTSNTYVISHNAGTAPDFRTPRTEGSDATTQVTVTKNAKLLTFSSTGGTAFNLIAGGVQVGDIARIGSSFNVANQGTYKILAVTATSFTVENESGLAESSITLGASFADEINIYSSAGVQIGDKINIIDGFSSVTHGTFEISDVSHDYLEFESVSSLPEETGISNSPAAFLIYRDLKQFLYIESDQKLEITLNSSNTVTLNTMNSGIEKKNGVFMNSGSIYSATIENKSQNIASVFYISAE